MRKISLEEFKTCLSGTEPPEDFNPQAEALWYAGKGNWEKAHQIVQDLEDPVSYRIHAFLHRQEGDHSNARYWYNKAGIKMPEKSTDIEWQEIVSTL
ncbi:MAG TPA: hypothetical protein VGI38_01915 [Puia sp.]|jgi:hypothetical protein